MSSLAPRTKAREVAMGKGEGIRGRKKKKKGVSTEREEKKKKRKRRKKRRRRMKKEGGGGGEHKNSLGYIGRNLMGKCRPAPGLQS